MFNKSHRSFVKVIALLIALASVFSFVGCKKYSNPDERLNYVIEKSLVNELNASLDKSIKEFDSAKNDSEAVKVTIKPTLSSACLALLASSPVDLSIINDASIVLDTKTSKGVFEMGLGLNYKSSALISAVAHLDTLAKKLFVSDKTVSKWENGTAIPDIMNIPDIACILKVKPEFLVKIIWIGETGERVRHFIFVNVKHKTTMLNKKSKMYFLKIKNVTKKSTKNATIVIYIIGCFMISFFSSFSTNSCTVYS